MKPCFQHIAAGSAVLLLAIALPGAANEPSKTGPRITKFTLEPAQFYRGDALTVVMDYCEAKDGLESSVQLDYQGSLPNHSRKPSVHAAAFTGKEACGTFRGRFYPSPTDPAPFDLRYFVRLKTGLFSGSNWAEASVRYLGERPSEPVPATLPRVSDSPFARTLIEGSCWQGSWKMPNGSGKLELCFRNDGELLAAEVRNNSAGAPVDGPVTNLVPHEEARRVTFNVRNGARFDLRLAAEGQLEGASVLTHVVPLSFRAMK